MGKAAPRELETRLTDRPKATPMPRRMDEFVEANAILAAAAGDRLEALAVVMMYLGLRPFEALGLRWEHLNLDGPAPSLSVVESKAKRRHALAELPLPPKVAVALRSHKARQSAERLTAPYWHIPVCRVRIRYRRRDPLPSRLGDWWAPLRVCLVGLEHAIASTRRGTPRPRSCSRTGYRSRWYPRSSVTPVSPSRPTCTRTSGLSSCAAPSTSWIACSDDRTERRFCISVRRECGVLIPNRRSRPASGGTTPGIRSIWAAVRLGILSAVRARSGAKTHDRFTVHPRDHRRS